MASPAAVLDVIVQANTSQATASLSKFDRTLKGTGTTASKTSKYHDGLTRSTSKVGGALKSAALAAGSAAVAYLSISQIKSAITATEDLAKTTAGLNRNLGLTTKTASAWGAVAKSRDIDAKSLTMSFTTLSRRITDAGKGVDTAKDSFADIGLTQQQLAKTNGDFQKQLLLVADAFGEAEGGATRQQAAQKLLGRGYQTLLPLFAEGSKSLQDQLGWADKYGATLGGKTLKAQMDLVQAQRESKVAMLGLQVSFATALTPALQKANQEFQRIAEIMGSDKLSQAEKFERIGHIIGKWADKAFDAFVGILPKIIETAGQKAPKIAEALAKGFLNADIWGKLLVGGWLISKLGGLGAFRKTGSTAGKAFGKGWILGLALALPALLTEAEKFGEKIGHAIQDAVAPFVEDFFGLKRELTKGEVIQGVKAGAKSGDLGVDQALDALEKVGVGSKKAAAVVNKAYGFMDESTQKSTAHVTENTRDMSERGSKAHRNLSNNASAAARSASRNVSGSTNDMVNAVGDGYNRLKDNTNKALQAFGVKQLSFAINQRSDRPGGTRGAGGHHTFQEGGHVVPGTGSGDKYPVHAMLEPGEIFGVFNRNAAPAIEAMNKAFPRFASGGFIHPSGTPGGAVVNAAIADQVAAWLQRYQMTLTAGYDPGGGHVSPGHNVTGTALDTVPTAGWGAGPTKIFESGLRAALAAGKQVLYGSHGVGTPYPNHGWGNHAHTEWGMGGAVEGAVAAKIKRVILNGPNGPLKDMGQGGLDRVWKSAKDHLAKQTVSFPAASAGGQFDKAGLSRLWSSTGSNGNANLMAAIALAESGGNPSVTNSIGARGLWQIMPATAAGFGFNYAKMTNPAMNAKAAHAILAGQGLGAWEAYTNGAYRQYMQKGGFVGSYKHGGVVPRDGMAQVHKGEKITPADRKEWDRLLYEEMRDLHSEIREEHRRLRQARGVFRAEGRKWFVDAMGEEIADVAIRSSRYAGTGQLTAIRGGSGGRGMGGKVASK